MLFSQVHSKEIQLNAAALVCPQCRSNRFEVREIDDIISSTNQRIYCKDCGHHLSIGTYSSEQETKQSSISSFTSLVDIDKLKTYALSKLPTSSTLRRLILSERKFIGVEEFINKTLAWLKLIEYENTHKS